MNAGPQMTTTASDNTRNSSERVDGALANVLTGMGVAGKDKKLENRVLVNALLSEPELEQLYKNGLIRRFIDAIPETILRHQPTITLGSETGPKDRDLVSAFDAYLRDLQFAHALREVVQLQRLYGGAGLVLLLDDGGAPEEPVNPNRLRALRGCVPLSRHELIPDEVTYTDYSKPEYYRITTTQRLTPDQTESTVNLLIHRSRVARFDGLYLPWNLRARNTGWGMSCVEVIWDAFQNYEGALSGLANLLSEGDLLVHKIPGLMQRIAAGGEADIRKRLEINNLARSVYGSMVLDKEEELDNLSRALSNISQATEPFISHLQAVTGWPASILMGDSPGGLGKEGRFEERVWASLVESWQEVYCRTPITEIFQYILLSKEGPTKGKPPESWEVHFPSVFTKTEEEKADLYSKMATADNVYVQLGALDAIEIRQSRFGKTEFSIETELDDTITERLQAQSEMQFEQQVAGFEAQMQAAQMGQVPPETGELPGAEGGLEAPQAPEGQAEPQAAEAPGDDDEGGLALPPLPEDPTNRRRGDAFDVYEAQGLRIRITHAHGVLKAGYLVAPDGQRLDTSENAAVMIFGPHRTKAYKLYRARFVNDAQLVDGPYVTGFASMKSAKQGVAAFYPRQTVAGLSVVPAAELESLRAGWETY